MWLAFLGLAISLAWGLTCGTAIYFVASKADAQQFLIMFIGTFNMLVCLGLIVGTALIVKSSQHLIPATIEAAFTPSQLARSDYFENKRRFYSRKRTVLFASEFMLIGWIIFALCDFPLSGLGGALLMTSGCAQWAAASYVGRKLRYAGQMLHSLVGLDVTRNLFKKRELDPISAAVHVAATLTIIFIYLNERSYYGAPFRYDMLIGKTAQVFLLLPAVLATPVLLIFTFLPRMVLRRIYDKSIDVEVGVLQGLLQDEALSPYEKELRLVEFNKLCRDELRYSLQLTITDLPIGVTILIMLLQPLLKG
jgi:hypothetical protein